MSIDMRKIYIAGRAVLIFLMSFMLVFGPVLIETAPVLAAGNEKTAGKGEGGITLGSALTAALSDFTGMFTAGGSYAGDDVTGEASLEELQNNTYEFTGEALQDERIRDALLKTVKNVSLQGEGGATLNDLILKVLGDDDLRQMLGDVIASYLLLEEGTEERIFLEQITADIFNLIQDDEDGSFKEYLRSAVNDFSSDERVTGLMEDIFALVMAYSGEVLDHLGGDSAFSEIPSLINDFLDYMGEELLDDPAHSGMADIIYGVMENIEEIPEGFRESLEEDEDFQQAMENLRDVFWDALLDPLFGDLGEAGVLEEYLGKLMTPECSLCPDPADCECTGECECPPEPGCPECGGGLWGAFNGLLKMWMMTPEEAEPCPFCEGYNPGSCEYCAIRGEMGEALGNIGDDIDTLIGAYADGATGGDDGGGGCEVEAEMGDWLMHWADVLFAMFGDEDYAGTLMDPITEYFTEGVGADHIDNILAELMSNLERSLEVINDEESPLAESVRNNLIDPYEEIMDELQSELFDIVLNIVSGIETENVEAMAGEFSYELNVILYDIFGDEYYDDPDAPEEEDTGEAGTDFIDQIFDNITMMSSYTDPEGDSIPLNELVEDIAIYMAMDAECDDEECLCDSAECPYFGMDNAQKTGYALAEDLLDNLAELIIAEDACTEPGCTEEEPCVDCARDQEREIIKEGFTGTDRLKWLYEAMEGRFAETDEDYPVTEDSGVAGVVFSVITEILHRDEEDFGDFYDDLFGDEESAENDGGYLGELVEDESGGLKHYGQRIGGAALGFMDRIFAPFLRLVSPRRYVRNYNEEEQQRLENMLSEDRIASSLKWMRSPLNSFLGDEGSKMVNFREDLSFPDYTIKTFLEHEYEGETGLGIIVSPERSGAVYDFIAAADAEGTVVREDLKDLEAGYFAEDLKQDLPDLIGELMVRTDPQYVPENPEDPEPVDMAESVNDMFDFIIEDMLKDCTECDGNSESCVECGGDGKEQVIEIFLDELLPGLQGTADFSERTGGILGELTAAETATEVTNIPARLLGLQEGEEGSREIVADFMEAPIDPVINSAAEVLQTQDIRDTLRAFVGDITGVAVNGLGAVLTDIVRNENGEKDFIDDLLVELLTFGDLIYYVELLLKDFLEDDNWIGSVNTQLELHGPCDDSNCYCMDYSTEAYVRTPDSLSYPADGHGLEYLLQRSIYYAAQGVPDSILPDIDTSQDHVLDNGGFRWRTRLYEDTCNLDFYGCEMEQGGRQGLLVFSDLLLELLRGEGIFNNERDPDPLVLQRASYFIPYHISDWLRYDVAGELVPALGDVLLNVANELLREPCNNCNGCYSTTVPAVKYCDEPEPFMDEILAGWLEAVLFLRDNEHDIGIVAKIGEIMQKEYGEIAVPEQYTATPEKFEPNLAGLLKDVLVGFPDEEGMRELDLLDELALLFQYVEEEHEFPDDHPPVWLLQEHVGVTFAQLFERFSNFINERLVISDIIADGSDSEQNVYINMEISPVPGTVTISDGNLVARDDGEGVFINPEPGKELVQDNPDHNSIDYETNEIILSIRPTEPGNNITVSWMPDLIGDLELQIDADILRNALHFEPHMNEMVYDKLSSGFSDDLEKVMLRYLEDEAETLKGEPVSRAFKAGYMLEDIPSRLKFDILTEGDGEVSDLGQFSRDVITGDITGFFTGPESYNVGERILSTVSDLVNSETIFEVTAGGVFEFLTNMYETFHRRIVSFGGFIMGNSPVSAPVALQSDESKKREENFIKSVPHAGMDTMTALLGISPDRESHNSQYVPGEATTPAGSGDSLNAEELVQMLAKGFDRLDTEFVDGVIWELLDKNRFVDDVQPVLELLAGITGDGRLAGVIDGPLADNLQDGRLADDVDSLHKAVFDLLNDSGAVLISEDFAGTFPPENWDRETTNGTHNWERTTVYALSGDASASFNNTEEQVEGRLYTPQIELGSEELSYELSFWERGSNPDNYTHHSVWVQDAENNYHLLGEMGESDNAWHRQVFDLSAFSGETIKICFYYHDPNEGTRGDSWYIDDITVNEVGLFEAVNRLLLDIIEDGRADSWTDCLNEGLAEDDWCESCSEGDPLNCEGGNLTEAYVNNLVDAAIDIGGELLDETIRGTFGLTWPEDPADPGTETEVVKILAKSFFTNLREEFEGYEDFPGYQQQLYDMVMDDRFVELLKYLGNTFTEVGLEAYIRFLEDDRFKIILYEILLELIEHGFSGVEEIIIDPDLTLGLVEALDTGIEVSGPEEVSGYDHLEETVATTIANLAVRDPGLSAYLQNSFANIQAEVPLRAENGIEWAEDKLGWMASSFAPEQNIVATLTMELGVIPPDLVNQIFGQWLFSGRWNVDSTPDAGTIPEWGEDIAATLNSGLTAAVGDAYKKTQEYLLWFWLGDEAVDNNIWFAGGATGHEGYDEEVMNRIIDDLYDYLFCPVEGEYDDIVADIRNDQRLDSEGTYYLPHELAESYVDNLPLEELGTFLDIPIYDYLLSQNFDGAFPPAGWDADYNDINQPAGNDLAYLWERSADVFRSGSGSAGFARTEPYIEKMDLIPQEDFSIDIFPPPMWSTWDDPDNVFTGWSARSNTFTPYENIAASKGVLEDCNDNGVYLEDEAGVSRGWHTISSTLYTPWFSFVGDEDAEISLSHAHYVADDDWSDLHYARVIVEYYDENEEIQEAVLHDFTGNMPGDSGSQGDFRNATINIPAHLYSEKEMRVGFDFSGSGLLDTSYLTRYFCYVQWLIDSVAIEGNVLRRPRFAETTLYSEEIDLTGITADERPVLEFYESSEQRYNYYHHSVGLEDTANGEVVYQEELGRAPSAPDWRRQRIDLSDYAGDTLRAFFHYRGSGSDTWYIDDFRLRIIDDYIDRGEVYDALEDYAHIAVDEFPLEEIINDFLDSSCGECDVCLAPLCEDPEGNPCGECLECSECENSTSGLFREVFSGLASDILVTIAESDLYPALIDSVSGFPLDNLTGSSCGECAACTSGNVENCVEYKAGFLGEIYDLDPEDDLYDLLHGVSRAEFTGESVSYLLLDLLAKFTNYTETEYSDPCGECAECTGGNPEDCEEMLTMAEFIYRIIKSVIEDEEFGGGSPGEFLKLMLLDFLTCGECVGCLAEDGMCEYEWLVSLLEELLGTGEISGAETASEPELQEDEQEQQHSYSALYESSPGFFTQLFADFTGIAVNYLTNILNREAETPVAESEITPQAETEVVLLEEGFESTDFPPGTWSRDTNVTSENWERSTSEANSGVASAAMTYYSGRFNESKPTGSVSINGHYTGTNNFDVDLSISRSSTAITQMRFRNGTSGTWSAWESFSTSKSWALDSSTTESVKTVQVQFRTSSGEILSPVSTSVRMLFWNGISYVGWGPVRVQEPAGGWNNYYNGVLDDRIYIRASGSRSWGWNADCEASYVTTDQIPMQYASKAKIYWKNDGDNDHETANFNISTNRTGAGFDPVRRELRFGLRVDELNATSNGYVRIHARDNRDYYVGNSIVSAYRVWLELYSPSINSQPSGRMVDEGTSPTFSVSASCDSGGTLSYRWQRSDDDGETWNDISGATGSSYTLDNASYNNDNGALFRCAVSNAGGGHTVSQAVPLEVKTLETNLISRFINTSSDYEEINLEFYEKGSFATWYNYHGIWVEDENSNLHEISELGAPGTEWARQTVDISQFAGEAIRILFKYRGTDADNWYIDDVKVYVPKYQLTAQSSPTGGGSLSGGGSYIKGETVSMNASANEGYRFVNWTENGTEVSSDTAFDYTMPGGDVTLTANFVEVNPLVLDAYPSEGGTVEGAGEYAEGEIVSVNANANAGYYFVNWTEDGTEISSEPGFDYTMPADSAILTANFAKTDYTLTIEGGAGGTTNPAGNLTRNIGDVVHIDAIADTGYELDMWTTTGGDVANPYTEATTFTMPAEDVTLTANFKETDYMLTVQAEAGGEVKVDTGSGNEVVVPAGGEEIIVLNYEDEISIEAVPEQVYDFDGWTATAGTIGNSATEITTFTMPAEDATLKAWFEYVERFELHLQSSPPEGGTVDGMGFYQIGTDASVSAQPATGYDFENWTLDGTVVSTQESFDYTMPGEDTTLVANFVKIDYELTLRAGEGGSITSPLHIAPEGSDMVIANYEDVITVTAEPIEGEYVFKNWTVDGEAVNGETLFDYTMPAQNVTLTANFAKTYKVNLQTNPVEGGTVTDETGEVSYLPGTEVRLRATPQSSDYAFVDWTDENGNILSTNRVFSYTLSEEDVTLTANFTDNVPVYIPDQALREAIGYALLEPGIDEITTNDMLNLYSLSASERGIKDLSGLEHAKNLRHLDLYGNNLPENDAEGKKGISALSGLIHLESLHLSHTGITDIGDPSGEENPGLSQLTGLKELDLSQNLIQQIDALSGMEDLRMLNLSGNAVENVTPLSGTAELKWLNIRDNNVANNQENRDVLQTLVNLEWLNLSDNGIGDVGFLSHLNEMNHLILANTGIDSSNLADLSGMGDLNYLDLSGNNITDLSHLDALTSLETLKLADNGIADADLNSLNWGGLSALQELDLSENIIGNVTPLSVLSGLQKLDLSGNSSIADISDFSALTGLQRLDLSGNNNISNMSVIAGMEDLVYLYLSGTGITGLSFLEGMTFKELDLSDNGISDITSLSQVSFIQFRAIIKAILSMGDTFGFDGVEFFDNLDGGGYLDLSGNQLGEGALSHLSGKKLQVLDLSYNQLGNDDLACVMDIQFGGALGGGMLDLSGNWIDGLEAWQKEDVSTHPFAPFIPKVGIRGLDLLMLSDINLGEGIYSYNNRWKSKYEEWEENGSWPEEGDEDYELYQDLRDWSIIKHLRGTGTVVTAEDGAEEQEGGMMVNLESQKPRDEVPVTAMRGQALNTEGEPLAGAEITALTTEEGTGLQEDKIKEYSVVSGSDGTFYLPLPAGTYRVEIRSDGYKLFEKEEITAQKKEDGTRAPVIDLDPVLEVLSVELEVFNAEHDPLSDVQITARKEDGGESYHIAGSSEEGRYRLPLSPGSYSLEISRDGYLPVNLQNVVVDEEGLESVVMELLTVEGKVEDIFGNPLEDVRIITLNDSLENTANTVTGADGTFKLGNYEALLQPGSYRLEIENPGYLPAIQNIIIDRAGNIEGLEDINLERLGDVTGTGEVEIADAILALRHIVGLTALDNAALARAKVNGSENLSIADAIAILRHIVGLQAIN